MRLGVREAAEMLNVSEKTIYRWISQEKLPHYRINEQHRFTSSWRSSWHASPWDPRVLETASQSPASAIPSSCTSPSPWSIPGAAVSLQIDGLSAFFVVVMCRNHCRNHY